MDASRPHDKYFRSVFSNTADAESLLRAYVPEALARTLKWSTLTLYRSVGFEAVAKHVEYVLATQPDEHRAAFVESLRRNVPGRGGEVMNYVEQMIERGRRQGLREGLQEGELRGQIRTIEGLLGRDVPWSTIEAATGIDEDAFRTLQRQLGATDGGGARAN